MNIDVLIKFIAHNCLLVTVQQVTSQYKWKQG